MRDSSLSRRERRRLEIRERILEAAVERFEAEGRRSEVFAGRLREAASRVDVISRLWPAPEANLARYEAARESLQRCSEGV